MQKIFRFCFLSLGLIFPPNIAFAGGQPAAAQPATKPDDDFFLQGEFAGRLEHLVNGLADQRRSSIGVQVTALGDGNFQAVEYSGGLPGNGWDLKTRRKFTGRRIAAGIAELAGDGRQLTVRRESIVVKDLSGQELGRLPKLERKSQTLGAAPPAGAIILFSGWDSRQFKNGVLTTDHLLASGTETRQSFGDFTMHLEFRTPYMPRARDQARGNSGVYIQGRYEMQILDSFGMEGNSNECGSLYRQQSPLLNMCFAPLSWQTYDIDFTAARFDDENKKTRNARITARHNGIVIHNYELTSKTGAGAAESPDLRPIKLQDHGNPVHFRNIWIVERKGGRDAFVSNLP